MIKDIVVAACEECNGAGFLFYGSGEDYSVEQCDCVDPAEFDWINMHHSA
jgi:hypothetical protein